MQKKLVEVVEGQAKSAVEESRCKPDSWSKPEKSKYSGLSEELGEVSCGSNKREFGWLCVCFVSVERCWSQDQGQALQTHGEIIELNL